MKKQFFLVSILAAVLFSSAACLAQSAPKYDDSYNLKGLKEQVIVRRDDRSIPYIEAQNEADLYFVQGYETARDRLWQMDLLRRIARGQLSELFGKDALAEDQRWRRFGFSQIADESIKTLNPKLKNALDNYARGVNAYRATLNEENLPPEFTILQYEPSVWKSTDTLVIGKILADGLTTTWWQDLNRAALKKNLSKEKFDEITNKVTKYDVVLYGKDSEKPREESEGIYLIEDYEDFIAESKAIRKKSLERIGFYAERLAASNNWVISGKRTADGNAILANDPHLQASAPGIWYLTHLSAPGMRVSGVTFPGVPGIVLGHNEHIAWGATNVGPDVQDIYVEKFNEKGEYKSPDGWKKPVLRNEIIKVRPNLFKPDTVDQKFEVLETNNGVIFRNNGKNSKLSLKWTARNPQNQEFEAFINLNTAKNWNEFTGALRNYNGATQNFVYADIKGNIGWHIAGEIPIRRKGDGAMPYDGSQTDGDWIGSIPFEELPKIYNPESGYIVTANQRIAGTDYKYQELIRQFAAPWRAKRIVELIKANKKISMNDVSDIQLDVFNFPLSEFAREVVRRNAASAETIKILKGWDGKMTAESVGALLANNINACVGSKIAAENKPARSWAIRQAILPSAMAEDNKLWLPKDFQSWDGLLRKCDAETNDKLTKNKIFGENKSNWNWGKFNVANFQHPIAIVPVIGGQFTASFTNVDGSAQTPNVGKAVSMRFIAKPADWDITRHVIPLGQSGDPQSPYWNDQFEMWRTGKPAIFPFTQKAVTQAAKKTTLIKPQI